MRKFNVVVNGTAYEVEVEEVAAGASSAPVVAAAPKAAPAAAAGGEPVKAPMPGTIMDVKVNVGDTVERGQVVIVLEAMKMEIPVVAPEDGTVASIDVAVGDAVEAGQTLATLN